jgi:hypothetical protein
MPHARKTDPHTSHEAAASVENITETQKFILKALVRPRTDGQLIEAYRKFKFAPQASESGIRSRRAELARDGLVEVVGEVRLPSGRRSRVWKAVAR